MDSQANWIPVLESGDKVLIAILKSLLEDANIQYVVEGEGLQDIFALGSLGTGYNPLVGPMILYVDQKDEEDVKQLIESLSDETQWIDDELINEELSEEDNNQ